MIVGADVPALTSLVSALIGRARKIERTKDELTMLIRDLPWVGPDRERFLSEWNEVHQPNLIRLIDDMTGASNDVRRAANAQEQASRG